MTPAERQLLILIADMVYDLFTTDAANLTNELGKPDSHYWRIRVFRRVSGVANFRVGERCVQTERIPHNLATAPAKCHDVDVTNSSTTTKSPPSCSHEPREIHPHLHLWRTLPLHDTPTCVRSPSSTASRVLACLGFRRKLKYPFLFFVSFVKSL